MSNASESPEVVAAREAAVSRMFKVRRDYGGIFWCGSFPTGYRNGLKEAMIATEPRPLEFEIVRFNPDTEGGVDLMRSNYHRYSVVYTCDDERCFYRAWFSDEAISDHATESEAIAACEVHNLVKHYEGIAV